MSEKDPCIICELEGATTASSTYDGVQQHCRRCGAFSVARSALGKISKLERQDRLRLACTMRRANMASGAPTQIHTGNLDAYLSAAIPDPLELADEVFLFLANRADRFTHFIDPSQMNWELRAMAYSLDWRDVRVLIADLLVEPGFLKAIKPADLDQPEKYRITREGYQRLAELRKRGADGVQCFVAMWFGGKDRRTEMTDLYMLGLAAGIERAGYKPYRVDRAEYNGKIDDEIILQIRRSKFLVADFTEHVRGVYFEAGFADGLGLPVIQTCREDQIGDLHFDNRQVNTITWTTVEELADKLHKRIEATLGRGPLSKQ